MLHFRIFALRHGKKYSEHKPSLRAALRPFYACLLCDPDASHGGHGGEGGHRLITNKSAEVKCLLLHRFKVWGESREAK